MATDRENEQSGVVGNIELHRTDRKTRDGRVEYQSLGGAWTLLVPCNRMTEVLTEDQVIEIRVWKTGRGY